MRIVVAVVEKDNEIFASYVDEAQKLQLSLIRPKDCLAARKLILEEKAEVGLVCFSGYSHDAIERQRIALLMNDLLKRQLPAVMVLSTHDGWLAFAQDLGCDPLLILDSKDPVRAMEAIRSYFDTKII